MRCRGKPRCAADSRCSFLAMACGITAGAHRCGWYRHEWRVGRAGAEGPPPILSRRLLPTTCTVPTPFFLGSFKGVDIALFSAGGSISKKFAGAASAAGATVVDNSSAFRMTEGVPLVIPEVNPEAMAGMKAGHGGVIANPNCSTIIALVVAAPLHRLAGIKRMVVSTYQVRALARWGRVARLQGRALRRGGPRGLPARPLDAREEREKPLPCALRWHTTRPAD